MISTTARRRAAIRAMICEVNYARGHVGSPRVGIDSRLSHSASHKARDIIACGVFSHNACSRPFTWWIAESYTARSRCWLAGETIAWGSASLGTPREIFRGWMHSPPHRKAILSRSYREIGAGFRIGDLNGLSDVRVWVLHLGTLC